MQLTGLAFLCDMQCNAEFVQTIDLSPTASARMIDFLLTCDVIFCGRLVVTECKTIRHHLRAMVTREVE
jgi:hypothetical protein